MPVVKTAPGVCARAVDNPTQSNAPASRGMKIFLIGANSDRAKGHCQMTFDLFFLVPGTGAKREPPSASPQASFPENGMGGLPKRRIAGSPACQTVPFLCPAWLSYFSEE